MAKRTTSQSQAGDAAQAAAAQPKPRRSQSASTAGDPADGSESRKAAGTVASAPSEDDIRLRAYHRYLQRGGGHGMDFEDWLEAERELKSQK